MDFFFYFSISLNCRETRFAKGKGQICVMSQGLYVPPSPCIVFFSLMLNFGQVI